MTKKSDQKVITKYNGLHKSKPFKTNQPSLTVQDESYTIQELINKHVQGIMPSVGLTPQYDGEDATHDDDITLRKPNLDLTDIDELKEKVKNTQRKIKQKAIKEKREKEKYDRPSEDKVVKPKDEA